MKTDKKDLFLYYWKMIFPWHSEPIPEYRFAPPRLWRFDWAFVSNRVAVEVEGGIWVRGAHTRGRHFESDCEKYNSAASMNWLVFRFSPEMIERDPAGCCARVLLGIETHTAGLLTYEVNNATT